MEERTKRGEEDRQRELDQMTGKPVHQGPADAEAEATPNTTTTRDKGVEPTNDARHSQDGRTKTVKPH